MDILKLLDSVVDMIPSFVESRSSAASKAERFRLGELLSQLQDSYLPQLLMTCRYPASVTQQAPRQKRVLACMKALRVLASDLHFNVVSAETLQILRKDEMPLISLHAGCTIARIACQAQVGIMHSVWISHHKMLFMKCYPTLQALKVLSPLEDFVAEEGLWQQLQLGLNLEPAGATSDALWESIQKTNGQLADQSVLLGPDDLQYLDQLRVRASGGDVTSELPRSCKFALTRGRTIILIALLQSMVTSPLPEDGLNMTLETLRFVTKSSLVRFASRRAQVILVELLSQTVRKLYSKFGGGSEVVEDIIGVLFDVLVTVGYPRSIEDAEIFIEEYLALVPDCAAAMAALQELKVTRSLVLLD